MKPLFKRRRVSSNPHTPLQPDTLVSSLKPSRVSTCAACHRAVCPKSNPAFLCARCNASTCAICLRTCSGHVASLSNMNNSCPPRRRRPRDEDGDNISKSKDVDSERSGCGQMVCRMCCFEHPQSGAIACLGCSAKQLATQTHESNISTQGARNSDQSLIASS